MNMKHLGTVAAAALLLSGAQALAATVTVDSFDTFQSVTDEPAAGSAQTNTSTIDTPSAIGGTRTLTAENTLAGATEENATTLTSGSGRLAFSNNEFATGRGTLTYSGLNLSAQSGSFFTFNDVSFDNDFDLMFGAAAEDADGTRIEYSELLADRFSTTLSFTEFSAVGGAGLDDFDFGNITQLMFAVDSTGLSTRVDGSIGSITLTTDDLAPIPLPAAGFLLLGGLGGFAALRARKKA